MYSNTEPPRLAIVGSWNKVLIHKPKATAEYVYERYSTKNKKPDENLMTAFCMTQRAKVTKSEMMKKVSNHLIIQDNQMSLAEAPIIFITSFCRSFFSETTSTIIFEMPIMTLITPTKNVTMPPEIVIKPYSSNSGYGNDFNLA